jgi:glycosyltransferase involved in cell wall biosynthesis
MNDYKKFPFSELHIVWAFPGKLEDHLSAATWLNTTSELRKMDWRISLVTSGQTGTKLISGVEVLCLSSPNIYILRNVIYHLKLILFVLAHWSDIDVVLFTQPSLPWMLPLIVLRRIRGARMPLMVMDTRTVPMEDWRKASMQDRLRGWLYNSMNMAANAWVDGQTAITQRMAEKVNIPAERLWGIWPSGADLDLFAPALGQRRWPVGDEPVHLSYIGVLHYERNLMALCQAVEMANAEGMQFRLSLTGEGTEMEELQLFASQTEGRIRVNPPVPHEQVPTLLAQVHIGVLPFPDEEKYRVSSPVKLFEYMAAGMPIFATRIVCHTDVVKNGSYVFWAEDSSPEGLLAGLRLVWAARSNLGQMGLEAAEAARAWTWGESARKLSEALKTRLVPEMLKRIKRNLNPTIPDK